MAKPADHNPDSHIAGGHHRNGGRPYNAVLQGKAGPIMDSGSAYNVGNTTQR